MSLLIGTTRKRGEAAAGVLTDDTQAFTVSVASSASNNTATLSPAVTSTTALVWGGAMPTQLYTGAEYNRNLFGLDLTDTSTVTATRGGNTTIAYDIVGTAIPFDTSIVKSVTYDNIIMDGSGLIEKASGTYDLIKDNCALVVLSQRNNVATANGDDHVYMTGEITGSDGAVTVTAKRGVSNNTFDPTIYYCVIEFQENAFTSIQPVSIALGSADFTNTASITTVDTAETITLWNGFRTTRSGSNQGEVAATIGLTDASTVTATRGLNAATTTYNATILEFNTGTLKSVQRFFDQAIDEDSTPTDITITSVDQAKSAVSYLGWRSDATLGNFAANLYMFKCALTSDTNLRIERFGNTSTNILASVEVFEFN